MNPLYPVVSHRAARRCEYCRAPEATFNFPFEVEHIVPKAAGGDGSLENLALACRSCNAFKSVRLMGVEPQTNVKVPLYHPRHQVWTDEFTVDPETLVVHGQTAIGKATVATLQMNSPGQLEARREWRRLGLFP
jgi:hypothetical protein